MHHIVGQHSNNMATYGELAIHNTKNVQYIDKVLHQKAINPLYSSSVTVNGIKWPNLRNFLYWNRSYEQQFDYGMQVVNISKQLTAQGWAPEQILVRLQQLPF